MKKILTVFGHHYLAPNTTENVQMHKTVTSKTTLWVEPKRKERKMKKFKKLFAMLLTLAMVMGMSVTTFAAPDDIDPDMMVDSVIGNS